LPYAPDEALEDFKKAVALFEQGLYEPAIKVTLKLYRQYGDVQAVWFPTWVRRVVKDLPDPKNHEEVLRWTIQSQGRPFLYTMALKGGTVSSLLMESYFDLGKYEEARKWADFILARNPDADIPYNIRKLCDYHLARGSRPLQLPSKTIWRSLPLGYREEDYFILVPLDEACKVLGLGCSIAPNPKMAGGKGIRVTKPDSPNTAWRLFLGHPTVERLENGKGHTEGIAYAPFEEDGKVWVPFYWLAKQVGIRGWEVRNGKIYVAPKQGTK